MHSSPLIRVVKHLTFRSTLGASNACLVGENPICSVPPSKGCKGIWPFVYGHALHECSPNPPPPPPPPSVRLPSRPSAHACPCMQAVRFGNNPSSPAKRTSLSRSPPPTTTTPSGLATFLQEGVDNIPTASQRQRRRLRRFVHHRTSYPRSIGLQGFPAAEFLTTQRRQRWEKGVLVATRGRRLEALAVGVEDASEMG